MKGIVTGKIKVLGEWDDISFDMDNFDVHYLGQTLPKFSEDNILELIESHTSVGKMVLSDGMKPLQYLSNFKLK